MTAAVPGVVVRQWLADFVAETLRSDALEQLVARLDAVVLERVPELSDRDIRRDLESSTRAHALAVLGGLTQDTVNYAVPEQAHAFARTLARRGYELRLLLRVYHVGQEAALDYLTDVIEERQLPRQFERSTLLRIFERATRWINTSVEALTETYMAERERGLQAALNRRTEIVRALLAGDELDAGQASAGLGFRLTQRQLAAVLWTDDDARWTWNNHDGAEIGSDDHRAGDRAAGGDELGLLERVVGRLAGALGGAGVFTLPAGSSALWAWIALGDEHVDAGVTSDISAISAAVAALVASGVITEPVRVALGAPASGVAGFRQSHHDALAARQVTERAAVDLGRVVPYERVEMAYLAGADPIAMRALIRRELGPLAGPEAKWARLRTTLLAYLRCHRSPEGAAGRLGVHKNTVRYRVQRIEESLGRRIDECGVPLELALECAEVYGVSLRPDLRRDAAAVRQPG